VKHTDNKGMALILTLMVVTIITAMVVEFAYGVYVSTNSLNNWQASQRLSLVAKSATQLGSGLLAEKAALLPYTYPGVFEISQKAPFEEIDSTITLRVEDENSKFNLNTLRGLQTSSDPYATPYYAFVRLLTALNLQTDIADRICYWIDSNTTHRPRDAKSETKNAKLDSIDELLLIPGIGRESYETLLPYVTIYGDSRININGAEVPVIMSLSDKIDRHMAENLISYREITPFETTDISSKVAGFETAGTSLLGHITVKGSSFRIIATASSGDVKRIIDSIVDISGSSRIVRYWKEM
jgi:general secretion pathway protein K